MQNNSPIKNLLLGLLSILIVVLIVNVLFYVMPMLSNLAASFMPSHIITVQAEGKATVAPDTASISFSVISRGKNPQELSTTNTDKMNAVIEFVKSRGIADKDMKTTDYNLSPDYQYDSNTGRNYITGYTLTQTITIKIRDFTKIPETLAGLTPLGVNQIGGVNFSIEDDAKALADARADAMKKAADKATQLAAAGGAHLGKVVSINESQSIPPIRYFAQSASMGMGAMSAPVAPNIQPGTQDLTVDENVVYTIE